LAEFGQVEEKTVHRSFDWTAWQVNHPHSWRNLGDLGIGMGMVPGEYIYVHPAVAKSDSKLPGVDIHTPRLSLSRSSERAGVESYEGYSVYVIYVQLRLTTIW
jgi:hypothetical protein